MKYTVELKRRAVKDLKAISLQDRKRIIHRIEALKDNLGGDVKKLTDHTPEYRMRSGQFRVLFEVERKRVVIYRVLHRKNVYR